MAKKLEVRNLTISFRTNNGAVRAVRDVSFDLEEGETLAIAGESGSGKSVTTRAVMGILAGNAIVEGGEIIYDGKDLLKIPEEDFHTLRGHKLSMVFQDPLSALNPIMRIGRQLTEAMILNNKERRADGRKRYSQMIRILGENIREAGWTGATDDADRLAEKINKTLTVSAKLENEWNAKFESMEELFPDRGEKPDFIRLGYEQATGETGDAFEKNFLTPYLNAAKKAIAHANSKARSARKFACEQLDGVQPLLEQEPLNLGECRKAARTAADAVEKAIDPLALQKDNLTYVYRSSIEAGLSRYARGLQVNPKEEKRYAADTRKHDKLVQKGKFAPSVVPLNLVDMDRTRNEMISMTRDLKQHLSEMPEDLSDQELESRARDLLDYLQGCACNRDYQLSKAVAKHHAIKIMREVGIPEPEKRYHQYPFEFSGGMRQRIVIAIALSANPDILICDEPTTALDVTIQAQILELINNLKKERNLSVIFITHDLGVVANMADKIAIMYAGKIVEYGTADDVFYDPRHPYTWALLSSMPDLETKEKLEAIPGTPPNMILPPKGDAFAARNQYALEIDLEEQPPMFRITDTHSAATWLLHPDAPKVEPPAIVTERIRRMLQKEKQEGVQA